MKDLLFKTDVAGYEISLTKSGSGRFIVIYGVSKYTYEDVNKSFACAMNCIKHALECEGKLD